MISFRKTKLGLLFFLLNCLPLHAHNEGIKTIYSIDEVSSKLLKKASPEKLYIFDLDETLILPINPIWQTINTRIDDFREEDQVFVSKIRKIFDLFLKTKKEESLKYHHIFVSYALLHTLYKPVETAMNSFINALPKNVNRIILTASPTGEFGLIPCVQKWRMDNLKQVNLDGFFNNDFNNTEIIFNEKDIDFKAPRIPVFYKGILSAAYNNKGVVLRNFLQKIQKEKSWMPNEIFFFDDTVKECECVLNEMKNLGIKTKCYCYRAAYKEKVKIENQDEISKYYDLWINNKNENDWFKS